MMVKMIGKTVASTILALGIISAGPSWGHCQGSSPDQLNALDSSKNPPLAKTESEKKILMVLKEINQGSWMANVHTLHGRMLRIFAESTNARNVVEIGTSNGYSALWLCLGLRTTGGRLTTFEIDPRSASLARANFLHAGVDHIVTLVEGDAHTTIDRVSGPIDILFLDADKNGYLDYLKRLLPLVRPGGLILADNMSKPTPSPAFIKAITSDPSLETVFLNMEATGLGVILKKH